MQNYHDLDDSAFRFDEDTHQYSWGPRGLLSVTSVLAAVGIADYSDYPVDPYYRARGAAVHLGLDQIIGGVFDRQYLEAVPEWSNYILAGERFLHESGAEVLLSEVKVFDLDQRYAGTVDLIIRWRGKLWLADWKCSKALPAAAIQLAAYCAAVPSLARKSVRYAHADELHGRMAIELRSNGDFKLYPYDHLNYFRDRDIWTAAASIAHWQIANNGKLVKGA